MSKKHLGLALILLFLVCGCSSRVDKYLKKHPDTPLSIKTSMTYEMVCPGMTREQVAAVMGKPSQINWDELDEKETWIYPGPKRQGKPVDISYYAFENDKVVRIENKKQWLRRRIDRYFKEHPERSEYKDTVINGETKMGMNRQEVKFAMGEPKEINKSNTSYTAFEQWVYGEHKKAIYLYFSNDKLII